MFLYDTPGLITYEKQRKNGWRLAQDSQKRANAKRQTGLALKVVSFPQGEGRVPSIRIAGKWLSEFGFVIGDTVILTASQDRIEIGRKETEETE